MTRVYWDAVQTYSTLRSFLAARMLQELDAGNRQALSAYNDVLGFMDEQDRQQAEAMVLDRLTDAEHIEHADQAEREMAR